MAAIRRFSIDQPPQRLYLDTDFIIAALVASEPHHERCRRFVERLAHAGLTTLYLSSYSWVEYAHVVTREKFRAKLTPGMVRKFELTRWADAKVRYTYTQHFLDLLRTMLSPFRRGQIGMNTTVAGKALGYMAEHNLAGSDALHVASMHSADVADLASLDAVFRRVDGLFLWNDNIHAPLVATPPSE